MVSGLVTSPCDQLRIFSGDARLMRMASKSATGFAISNGLERNMFLRFPRLYAAARGPQLQFSVPGSQFSVRIRLEIVAISAALRAAAALANCTKPFEHLPVPSSTQFSSTENWELRTGNCS